ncbi:hypothetical protein JCM10207_006633 [Rhodosporidiobolus poonsookiae]
MSDAPAHPINEALQATPQELGHKVFVGNLPFDATSESLKEVFEGCSDAQIIHRGTRSLGYGFVTYESEDAAAAAVSKLDKSEIAGRQVNVEIAKPMPANGSAVARAPRRAAKKAAELAATRETAQEGFAGEEGAEPTKKARKPRKPRGPRAPRVDDETEEAGDAPVSAAADQLANTHLEDGAAPAKTRKPRARKGRKGKAAAPAEGAALDGEPGAPPALAAPAAAAKPRAPRRRGPPAGAESKTLLFVGNLAFSVTNESLAAAFEGCQVKSATVVVRKFGQSAGRSKGFAFVDFATNEDQQKALGEFQGKELDGRPLSLKVAIQPQEGDEAGEGDKADKAVAAAQDGDDNEPEASIVAS